MYPLHALETSGAADRSAGRARHRLRRAQHQADRVHAVPPPAELLRRVLEQVAEMRTARGAADLGPEHALRAVLVLLDELLVQRRGERRPATFRVELLP